MGSPSSQAAAASKTRAAPLSAASLAVRFPTRPGGVSPPGWSAVEFGSVIAQAPVWMYDAQMEGVAGYQARSSRTAVWSANAASSVRGGWAPELVRWA